MAFLWIITGASLAVALIALAQARRNARRLEQLSQNYWELKFQNGELRVQLQQRTGEQPAPGNAPATPAPNESFVPLSSLKR
ncbi:MAG: hypothetical protein ACXVJO_13240 [Thermoanaerobaculia bacterium]